MRRLGFGYYTENKEPDEWATDFLDWLDRFCFYRPQEEIARSLRRNFETQAVEPAYAEFRLRYRIGPRAAALATYPPLARPVRYAIRKLAGLVLVSVKRAHV